jgi:ParB family chromosome partitioning protein
MGIGKRLSESAAGLAAALVPVTVDRKGEPQPVMARTAPGQLLAAQAGMVALQDELTALRDKLRRLDGSLVTRRIDPTCISPTRWANRHEASFATTEFEGLKASIALAGGNVQPVLVREQSPERYEVVFGHRRHRACLELGLPVLAVVAEQSLGDQEVFLSMERENRERADLSPFEQGRSYLSALEAGLFPSLRRLAEAVGVSHTWVRKSMLVAQLPEAVVRAFRSPLEIQPKHAEEITAALEIDRAGVMRRAEKLRLSDQRLSAAQTVQALLPRTTADVSKMPIQVGGHEIGSYSTTARGRLLISLNEACVTRGAAEFIVKALVDAITAMAARTPSSAVDAKGDEK